MTGETFKNWSGVLEVEPRRIERPADEAAVAELVARVRGEGGTLRPVGAGHSSMPLVPEAGRSGRARPQPYDADSGRDVAGVPGSRVGWMREIIPHERTLKFNEMEYALPREGGPDCFGAVRARVLERHRREVAWRVLYRTVAAEDAYLSPSFGRDTTTISVHQNAHLPFREFFADIEPIFRDFGGRPHWAKLNTLAPREVAALYPRWSDFCALRQRLDPDGVFLNEYLRRLLG